MERDGYLNKLETKECERDLGVPCIVLEMEDLGEKLHPLTITIPLSC